MSEQEEKYSAELDEALKQYTELKEQAASMDAAELTDTRLAVREEKEHSAIDRVKTAYGEKYDPMMHSRFFVLFVKLIEFFTFCAIIILVCKADTVLCRCTGERTNTNKGDQTMIALVEPCEKYLQSYIEAYDEYKLNDVQTYAFDDARAYDIFEKYENYRHERNLKPNRVGSDYYWLVDEERSYFIGEISIRHRLTDDLKRYGGHIGYGIRFSEWKKGYGTLMLRLALEKAKKIGITTVLITCNDDNHGSAKVMENNGFVLQDKVPNVVNGKVITTRRYTKEL